MSKIVTAILMAQAPERPNWFKGKNIPEEPKEPSREIAKYKGNKNIDSLLESWIEDSHWDLASTFINAKDIPEGTEFKELQEELSKFEKIWDAYRRELHEWRVSRNLQLDIQWKVYWANLATAELNTSVLEASRE
jgi:hypothetical protein